MSAMTGVAGIEPGVGEGLPPVQGGGRVNNDKRETGLSHHGRCHHEELRLVVGVVGACICHVVQDILAVKAKPEAYGVPGVKVVP